METYSQILIKNLQKHDPYKNMNEYLIRKIIGEMYGIKRARNIELEIELDELQGNVKIKQGKIKSPITQRMIDVDGDTYKKLQKKGYFKSSFTVSPIKSYNKSAILSTTSYTDLPNELKSIISEDLDCKTIISLLQTSKNQDNKILRKMLEKHFGFYTSKLSHKQLVNLCHSNDVKMVSDYTTVFLNKYGKVYVMGYNTNQYGMGINSKNRTEYEPQMLNFNEKVIDISSGVMNILLLTNDHRIYYTGTEVTPDIKRTKSIKLLKQIEHADAMKDYNRFVIYLDKGYLYGLGYFENIFDYEKPEKLSDRQFSKFYIYNDTLMAISKEGKVYMMGRNNMNLPVNSQRLTIKELLMVNGLENIVEIALTTFHLLFLNDQGEVYGTGSNQQGQLGLGLDNKDIQDLTLLPFKHIVHICSNHRTSYLITKDMRLYGCGSNDYHLLGLEDKKIDTNELIFIKDDVIKVVSEGTKVSILDINGDIWQFGDEEDYEMKKINLNLF
jgi:alpha-tubulin suppressor-like RCC1 family protein